MNAMATAPTNLADVVQTDTESCAIWLVPRFLCAHAWQDAAPLLRPAVERSGGRYRMEDLPGLLHSGEAQLFLVVARNGPRAAAVTQVVNYPSARRMVVLFCGGSGMRTWRSAGIAAIEEWATRCGCDGVEIFGRKGWAKALGYTKSAEILERRLQ